MIQRNPVWKETKGWFKSINKKTDDYKLSQKEGYFMTSEENLIF